MGRSRRHSLTIEEPSLISLCDHADGSCPSALAEVIPGDPDRIITSGLPTVQKRVSVVN